MAETVFACFLRVLRGCVDMLFSLQISSGVTVGSFLAASAIMGVVISVVFAGIRSFVGLYNRAYDERQKAAKKEKK